MTSPKDAAIAPPRDVFALVGGLGRVGAFGLWLAVLVRFGQPAIETGAAIAAALTRTSVALEHVAQDAGQAREATARLEITAARTESAQTAHAQRVESELAAMRTTLAEIRGSVAGRR